MTRSRPIFTRRAAARSGSAAVCRGCRARKSALVENPLSVKKTQIFAVGGGRAVDHVGRPYGNDWGLLGPYVEPIWRARLAHQLRSSPPMRPR